MPKPVEARRLGSQRITARPFADFMCGVDDGIWVSGVGSGLVRYDADSREVTARAEAGDVVQALECVDGVVWAAQASPSPALVGVDAATGKAVARVKLPAAPFEESSPASDGSHVWVLADPADPRIVVVDVDSGSVTGELPVPEYPVALRHGFGSLWIPTEYSTVARVDPASGQVQATIEVGPNPRFLTVGHGAVWVMNQADGSVSRIDPKTEEATTIAVAEAPIAGGDITAGPTAVWLRTWDGAARIDPRSGRVTDLVSIADGSGSIAEVRGSVWLSDHDHNAVHRLPWPPRP